MFTHALESNVTRVPQLAPFTGIRYASTLDPDLVTSPPYDVISPDLQRVLLDRHPRNFVRLILPPDGDDRYQRAAQALMEWQAEGTLVPDPDPSYYLYVMDYLSRGKRISTAGIIGALALERFGEGNVFPHEDTMPGPKADRLELMRATRANLEPLWFVASESLPGLKSIVQSHRHLPPVAQVTDSAGVRHNLWRVTPSDADDVVEQMQEVPIVIADGHHRYETAIAYRDERRAQDGSGPWDFVLAMVAGPADFGPTLLSIHRVVRDIDTRALMNRLHAEAFDGDLQALAEMVSQAGAGTIGLATGEKLWTVRSGAPLASVFLRDLLGPEAKVSYEHELEMVAEAMHEGATAFIMAPVPLSLVIERALAGERMPPKTTLFWPKPLSGLVFRSLD